MVDCFTDITNIVPCVCLLACMVFVAVRVDMEDVGDGVYDGIVSAIAGKYYAPYRSFAYACGYWRV